MRAEKKQSDEAAQYYFKKVQDLTRKVDDANALVKRVEK